MADVFISYAREDQARAADVARAFAAAGVTAFWDNEIPPGQTWADYIEGKLNQSRVLVVLWSEHSTKSQWVREEARMARNVGKLIPVMLDQSQPPFGFGEVQSADLRAWNGDPAQPEWQRFVRVVQERIAASGGAQPHVPLGAQTGAPQSPPQPQQAWAAPPAAASAWSSTSSAPQAHAPGTQLSPIGYVQKCLRLYADGKGRARRAEYGWLVVAMFVLGVVTGILDLLLWGVDPYTGAANAYLLTIAAALALLAPCIAAASRRAHDIGQSGWLAVLTIIPYIGFLAVLALIFIPGQAGPNQHGADPKS